MFKFTDPTRSCNAQTIFESVFQIWQEANWQRSLALGTRQGCSCWQPSPRQKGSIDLNCTFVYCWCWLHLVAICKANIQQLNILNVRKKESMTIPYTWRIISSAHSIGHYNIAWLQDKSANFTNASKHDLFFTVSVSSWVWLKMVFGYVHCIQIL